MPLAETLAAVDEEEPHPFHFTDNIYRSFTL